MKSAFEKAHKARFGFIDRSKQLVVEAVSVEAVGGGAKFREQHAARPRARKLPSPARRTQFFSGGQWHKAAVYTREQLAPGHKVNGPAIVIEPHQTIVVEDGWQAEITAKNHLVLDARRARSSAPSAIGTKADPVMLEVFNNLFMSIAEQMGVALQNTAYSVNIKERLDFSCAVFAGRRLAGRQRAAHAGASRLDGPRGRDHHPREQGQDPAGRRLRDQRALQRRHASARHHRLHAGLRRARRRRSCSGSPRAAITPISAASRRARCRRTPPRSRRKASTSTISSWSIAAASARRSSTTLLTGAKYPARNPLQNVNDLKAQIAANEKGVQELRKMVAHFGLPVVQAYMEHVQDNAAESVRRVIDRLHDCEFTYEMDQGTVIKVKITVDKKKREATVDFTGTSPQQADQLQRARAGDARRRALRVPRHGRRRHPDERRLPAADQHRHPDKLDAVAGLSGRRGRRQCRDLAGGDRHACSARSARWRPRRAP